MPTQRPGPATAHELDIIDRRILLELDRAPTAPISDIAHALDVGERTVSRRYARLHEEGMIRVIGRTLPGAGGRDAWLTRAFTDPSTAPTLARRLAQLPDTGWVRLSRDGTEITCGLVGAGRDSPALQLLARNPRVRRVETVEVLRVWGRDRAAATEAARGLDELDRTILTELGRDGRTETRRIAKVAGVDPSTISRRRTKLIEDGLLFFEARINPAALSGAGDALLWLAVLPGHIQQVGQALRELPECRFAAACSGRHSIVANLLTPSPDALVEVIDTRLAGPGVAGMDLVRLDPA